MKTTPRKQTTIAPTSNLLNFSPINRYDNKLVQKGLVCSTIISKLSGKSPIQIVNPQNAACPESSLATSQPTWDCGTIGLFFLTLKSRVIMQSMNTLLNNRKSAEPILLYLRYLKPILTTAKSAACKFIARTARYWFRSRTTLCDSSQVMSLRVPPVPDW